MRGRRWISGGLEFHLRIHWKMNYLLTGFLNFYHLFLLLLFSCLQMKICVHCGGLHQPLDHRIFNASRYCQIISKVVIPIILPSAEYKNSVGHLPSHPGQHLTFTDFFQFSCSICVYTYVSRCDF